MRRVCRAAWQKLERERNVINPHPFPAHHGGKKVSPLLRLEDFGFVKVTVFHLCRSVLYYLRSSGFSGVMPSLARVHSLVGIFICFRKANESLEIRETNCMQSWAITHTQQNTKGGIGWTDPPVGWRGTTDGASVAAPATVRRMLFLEEFEDSFGTERNGDYVWTEIKIKWRFLFDAPSY